MTGTDSVCVRGNVKRQSKLDENDGVSSGIVQLLRTLGYDRGFMLEQLKKGHVDYVKFYMCTGLALEGAVSSIMTRRLVKSLLKK